MLHVSITLTHMGAAPFAPAPSNDGVADTPYDTSQSMRACTPAFRLRCSSGICTTSIFAVWGSNRVQNSAIIYQFFIWVEVIALWIIEARKSQWKQKCNLLVLDICLVLWPVLYKSCYFPCLYVNSFTTSFSAAPQEPHQLTDRGGQSEYATFRNANATVVLIIHQY